jgi:hypothetical protein
MITLSEADRATLSPATVQLADDFNLLQRIVSDLQQYRVTAYARSFASMSTAQAAELEEATEKVATILGGVYSRFQQGYEREYDREYGQALK